LNTQGEPTFSSCYTGNNDSIATKQCIKIVFNEIPGRVDFPYETNIGYTNFMGLSCENLAVDSNEDNFRFDVITVYERE